MKLKYEVVDSTDRQRWLAARRKVITSTEVAGLFGLSEWHTPFSLWHEKKGELESSFKENERTRWGHRLERVVAEAAAERHTETISDFNDFRYNDLIGIGASFDFEITDGLNRCPLECKNVDGLVFRDKFGSEGDVLTDAPFQYTLQLQTEMLFHPADKILFACLVGGNRLFDMWVDRDPVVQQAIIDKVDEFWKMTEPPPPDYSQDWGVINRLFTQVKKGEELPSTEKLDSLMSAYHELQTIESNAAKGKMAIKAELLDNVRNASKVMGEKFTLSRSPVKPARIEYDRAGYSTFRVTARRGKK